MESPTRWCRHGRYPYLLAKYGLAVLVIVGTLALMSRLTSVVIPVLFAAALAFLLHPAVDFLSRRRVPRSLAAALMVVAALVALTSVFLLFVPTLVAQLLELASRVPDMIRAVQEQIGPILEDQFDVVMQVDPAAVSRFIQEHAGDMAAPSGWLVSRLFESVFTLGQAVLNLVIIVVFAFYLLKSAPEIGARALDLIPVRYRDEALLLFDTVDEALSKFIRGQISVSLILAAVYSVALTVIGVRGGAAIGIVAGLLNFIPYLGLVTGLLLSLLSVLLDYGGPGQVIAVCVLFLAVPTLDATVITPNVVGSKTGLNPFVVIVALLAGAELLGFLGILLALPTAAVIRALIRVGLKSYRRSRFYLGEGGETADQPPDVP